MDLFTKAGEKIFDKAMEKTGSQLSELLGSRTDAVLQSSVETWLREEYGEHDFFDDFYAYLSGGNVIGGLIATLHKATPNGSIGITKFTGMNLTYFLERYPQHSRHSEQIKTTLENIYQYIALSTTRIPNQYSCEGRLQSTINMNQAELTHQNQMIISMLGELIHRGAPSGANAVSLEGSRELADCTGLTVEFKQQIEDIEVKYQKQDRYQEALDQYNELLQSIAAKDVHGKSRAEILCTLYCNIAICNANLGREDSAMSSLRNIPDEVARSSATYHYIYAAILLQYRRTEQYPVALEHTQDALKLQPKHHRAYLLQQYLYTLLEQKDYKTVMEELASYLSVHSSEMQSDGCVGDYYQHCGLISIVCGKAQDAYNNFKMAIDAGYDEVIARVNMISALYMQAIESIQLSQPCLAPAVDNKKLIAVLRETQRLFEEKEDELSSHILVKGFAVKLCVSVCSALRIPHNLSPLSDFLPFADDYQALRAMILGSKEPLSEETIALLKQDDALFAEARKLFDENHLTECRDKLIKCMDKSDGELPLSLSYMFLEVCISLKDCEHYWEYRSKLSSEQIGNELLGELDAIAYEQEGKMDKAKELADELVMSSNDIHVLENILRFYHRNNFDAESEGLYLKIQNLHQENQVYIENPDEFYCRGMSFLTKNNRHTVEDFFDKIPDSQISAEAFLDIQAMYYDSINDAFNLYNVLNQKAAPSIQDRINKAICLRTMRRYEEGIELCLALAEEAKENQLKEVCYLVSNLYLLNSQPTESYAWAEKAHQLAVQQPYDESHQFLFARAFRCKRPEGLQKIVEYQDTHPNVVNFFKVLHIDPEEQNIGETLLEQLSTSLPETDDWVDREKKLAGDYRALPIPINLLLKYYHEDWGQLQRFALKNKLRLGLGNPERQQLETSWVKDDIVVDAQTLVLMHLFGCIPSLQSVKRIHITYGTVSALQGCFLSLKFDTLFIGKLMDWLNSEPCIVLEPDGVVDENDDIVKAFSSEFFAACNVAERKDIPFLCADTVVLFYQAVRNSSIPKGIRFVSVPVICNIFGKEKTAESEGMIYNLLGGGNFISFGANTILERIRADGYSITAESLGRFLICKSDYDMESFSNVYLRATYRLKEESLEAADQFSKLLLDNARRIWQRGTYYRDQKKRYRDKDATRRAAAIESYIVDMVAGMNRIWGKKSSEIVDLCEELKRLVIEEG